MQKIVKLLANYVIKEGTIRETERDIYEYAFLITLEKALCLITCFCISAILDTIVEGIIFFIIFIPLRSYAGGLHLENYWSCFSLSCLTFFVIMIMGKYIDFPVTIAFVMLLLLEMSVYKMYPIENKNRIVDMDENIHFKRKLQYFLLLDIVISVACIVFDKELYLQTIAMTFLMVTITMAIGKYKNKKHFS